MENQNFGVWEKMITMKKKKGTFDSDEILVTGNATFIFGGDQTIFSFFFTDCTRLKRGDNKFVSLFYWRKS